MLCEILKPGMSESEVLGILHKAGEFTLRRSDWTGGDIELGISFIDPEGKERYGTFDLRFLATNMHRRTSKDSSRRTPKLSVTLPNDLSFLPSTSAKPKVKMKRIILAIVFLSGIPGCTRNPNIQGASIAYKVYKQGIIFPIYPTYIVRDKVVETWNDPIVSSLGDNPQWSPDGKWVTFSTARYSSLNRRGSSSIYILSADGSKQYVVVNKGENHHPTWNPSGTKIAYDAGSRIWISDASCFFQGRGHCRSGSVFLAEGSNPDWSPNGEEIAFETNEHHIAVISLNDPQEQVTDLTPDLEAYTPDWSPEGKRLVFSAYDMNKDSLDIFLLDIAAAKLENLTDGIGVNRMPKWTKDGERIVFIASDRDALGNIIGLDDTVRSSAIFSINPNDLDFKRIGFNQDEMVIWYSLLP
jgi:Tol biopolymer transport system component